MVVPFSVAGTATGADYGISASPLTIPAGAVNGTITITGTADVPNFAFYKYEVTSMGTQNWVTIAAKQAPVKDKDLGEWNTLPFANGDYFLRLVIIDNVGASLEPCVIAVRVLNQ